MITFKQGDLFKSEMQTLVNATNTQGIMGGGIALAFARRFPAMYEDYRLACDEGEHTVLKPHLFYYAKSHWILNLATKDIIANDSKIENIAAGLGWLYRTYKSAGITSLAVPALGCGLGGLEWTQVKPLMSAILGLLDIPVEIYEPL